MDPTWTDIATTAILAAQLVVFAAAAAVGWRQVGEARRLREAQTRPFVVVDFDVEGVLIPHDLESRHNPRAQRSLSD